MGMQSFDITKITGKEMNFNRENKYNREIFGLDGTVATVDVYRVLDAFHVADPG